METAPGAVIGLGIDAVDVARLRRVLDRRPGLLERLFTEGEREYAARHGDVATRLSIRYAAKEATMKALGVGLGAFAFTDVEVVTNAAGAPSLRVAGAAALLAQQRGVAAWHVSLSHTATTGVAVVLGVA